MGLIDTVDKWIGKGATLEAQAMNIQTVEELSIPLEIQEELDKEGDFDKYREYVHFEGYKEHC